MRKSDSAESAVYHRQRATHERAASSSTACGKAAIAHRTLALEHELAAYRSAGLNLDRDTSDVEPLLHGLVLPSRPSGGSPA